jgi:predicted transcriptional regulator of viral defense system
VPIEVSVDPAIGGRSSWRDERRLSQLADRQHGVVARRQLLELGMGSRAIEHGLARDRLHMVHRGVYAVGHPRLTPRGRWMAAVLALGPDAALSHRSAGSLWRLLRSGRSMIEVTAARRWSRLGIELHRSALPPDEVTTADGIPVTTPNRTLFDLAAVVEPPALERAIERADAQRLTDSLSLATLLTRHPRRPGAAALRAILEARVAASAPTRCELEGRFLAFLAEHGLPRPLVNTGVEVRGRWLECDCVWPSHRLIVELDGRATHDTNAAFERDRARDRLLQAAGSRVVRITWRQLHQEDDRIAADLRKLMGD